MEGVKNHEETNGEDNPNKNNADSESQSDTKWKLVESRSKKKSKKTNENNKMNNENIQKSSQIQTGASQASHSNTQFREIPIKLDDKTKNNTDDGQPIEIVKEKYTENQTVASKNSLNEQSKAINQNQIPNQSLINQLSKDNSEIFKFRFHVFISPELSFNQKTDKFGLYSKTTNWEESKMIVFDNFKKFNNGWIATGEVQINKRQLNGANDFSYKYLIGVRPDDTSDWEYIVEYLGYFENREINLSNKYEDRINDQYDAIMLPPDEGNKNSNRWNFLKRAYNRFVKSFFRDDMFNKYLNDTIAAMLDDLSTVSRSQNEFPCIRNALTSMENVYNNLHSFYSRFKPYIITSFKENFFTILIKKIMKTEKRMDFNNSFCVLYLLGQFSEQNYLGYFDFSSLLRSLYVDQNESLSQFFDIREKNSWTKEKLNINYLKAIFKHFRDEPLSLHLLKVIVFLEFGVIDDQSVQFYTSNNVLNFFENIFLTTPNNYYYHTKLGSLIKLPQVSSILEIVPVLQVFLKEDSFLLSELETLFNLECFVQYLLICLTHPGLQRNLINYSTDVNKRFVFVSYKLTDKFLLNNEKNFSRLCKIKTFTSDILNSRLDNLKKLIDNPINQFEILLHLVKLDYFCAAHLNKHREISSNEVDLLESKKSTYDRIVQLIENSYTHILRINNTHLDSNDYKPFKIWTNLFDVFDQVGDLLKEKCNKLAQNYLLHDLKSLKHKNLIGFYKKLIQKENIFNSKIEKFTLEAIKQNIHSIGKNEFNDLMSVKNFHLLNDIFNIVIDTKWPVVDNPAELFSFIFQFFDFLTAFFFTDEKTGSIKRTEEHSLKLGKIISLLDKTLEDLTTGNVKIFLLKIFDENRNKVSQLYDLNKKMLSNKQWINDQSQTVKEYIDKLVELRSSEMTIFVKVLKYIQNFCKILSAHECIINQIQIENVHKHFEKYEKLDECELCELIEITPLSSYDKNVQMEIEFSKRVKHFGVYIKHVKIIDQLVNLPSDNAIVFYFIKQKCLPLEIPVDLETFISDILTPSIHDYNQSMTELEQGNANFKNFESFLKIRPNLEMTDQINHDWKSSFRKVMETANFQATIIDLRLRQFEIYTKLDEIYKLASVLVEITTKNELLESEFEFLQNLRQTNDDESYKNKKLKELDEETMRKLSNLQKLVDDDFVKCLVKYNENYSFVEWIRKKLPSLEALKFFGEMASEFENEGALEIVRTQSLSLVGDLYSPIIYHLKKDITYQEFISNITKVFENFNKNRNMTEKLESIAKERAWLEEIKEAKGNSEANSLNQAQRINSTGIYNIGYNNTAKKYNLTLDDLVKLVVPAHDETPQRTYVYSQLVELNDKLTLVVGKDDKQQEIIRYFSDILEGIISISNWFLNLMRTGNILFKNWNATIYSSKEHRYTIKVNFGLNEDNRNVFGERCDEKDTVNSINKTIRFLEKCHNQWMAHLNESRERISELNYYTIAEITLLRTKLAESLRETDLIHNDHGDLFNMLYYVNRNVDFTMLKQAHHFAGKKSLNDLEQLNPLPDDATKHQLYQRLKDSNVSEATIQNALQNCESDDFDQLIEYCFEHEITQTNEADLKLVNLDQLKEEIIPDESSSTSLELTYQRILETFLNYLDCDFDDFLSLNHLGRVLVYLRSKSTLNISRKKPSYLDNNTPNLIICPRDEIIRRVLSIYAFTSEQPLPADDEVLFCNGETSCEDVELFWNRVFSANESGKIYSLVNVQDLSYDQAVKAQTKFEKCTAGLNLNVNFTLIVFCSVEKEDKSVFATAFNRYRKNVPLDKNLDAKLANYMRANLTLKNHKNIEKDGLNVRVVTSQRAGVGKSLYIKRQVENAQRNVNPKIRYCCIPIKKQTLPFDQVFSSLKAFDCQDSLPNIYHLDIAYEVWYEVDYFLFNLVCLGILKNKNGEIFRRRADDVLFIEIMTPTFTSKDDQGKLLPLHSVLSILPTLNCQTPAQVFAHLSGQVRQPDKDVCPLLLDEIHLNSDLIQRPCQYLNENDTAKSFDNFRYSPERKLDARTCLGLLLRHLENKNPNWSEIIYFTSFLNNQLIDCETSIFCSELNSDILPGFRTFVVRFMIQLSHDFALPSLEISDCSALRINESNKVEFELEQLNMRRKWENDPHPYLFFNPDGHTFTFFGFYVNRSTGQLIDSKTQRPLFDNKFTLTQALMTAIDQQVIDVNPNKRLLSENVSALSKKDKIRKLLAVMGGPEVTVNDVIDPDESYELTMDNLLKMMAIYTRMKANIPIVIMGETGCGKTRLCRYLCELLKSPYGRPNVRNMVLMKVHGGVSAEDIKHEVEMAQRLARQNTLKYPGMFTVLFFDEANSTEAIGTIKEIMCDMRIDGCELDHNSGLKIIAACNPYKKHSDKAIESFEQSGLGFYVDRNETQEKLGDLPMRHLVYRVQPLPAAMLPIVWDFGQLTPQVEESYIAQIVAENLKNVQLDPKYVHLLSDVLNCSQKFMKKLSNECSFVSLRDIQRALRVFKWFLKKGSTVVRRLENSKLNELNDTLDDDEEIENNLNADENIVLDSIILALNTCYHVGLQSRNTRSDYLKEIHQVINKKIKLTKDYIGEVINNCYELFLNEINLPEAIARNEALKENIFMILICVELKIPLFLIGKPGSSKTLAKTLIALKMQGSDRLKSKVLGKFKEAQLITFQCSPLSTSDMILKTFRHCAKYQLQRNNDLDRYTSAVVLDEIGLAEGSSSMPLKVLHPLLEDGVYFDEEEERNLIKNNKPRPVETSSVNAVASEPSDWHRVGFIGISNWVLDPAKMNRGIFVNRTSPSINELKDTVTGICKNDKKVLNILENMKLIDTLSNAYLDLCEKAKNKTREFFGLRDFYSLIKMIYWHLKENAGKDQTIQWAFLEKCILRNFGGLIDINPLSSFIFHIKHDDINLKLECQSRPKVIELIKEALLKKTTEDENRYLLLLSQNDNALDLINNFILNEFDSSDESRITNKPKIIFGSSFPYDQRYSEICRKIHQIKLSMELGKTVILLNLENLYESLYDALNQFYYKFSESEKFVDLGLGTARVKCLVHNDFRLIIVADKKSVYDPKKYPIPLVNRLEKHLLSVESILNDKMKQIDESVKKWVNELTDVSCRYGLSRTNEKTKLKPSDIFIGMTDETIASLIYKTCRELHPAEMIHNEDDQIEWLKCAKDVEYRVKCQLIQCSTSDGIIRLLQPINPTLAEVVDIYYGQQSHDSFGEFMRMSHNLGQRFIQITTHSKLIYNKDANMLKSQNTRLNIQIKSLLTYDTQQQFVQDLRDFFNLPDPQEGKNILIVQCECGHLYQELLNCARFTILDEYGKLDPMRTVNFHVILIVQIPKIAGTRVYGLQTCKWFCYHIDDLQDYIMFGNILKYKDKSLGEIYRDSLTDEDNFQLLVNLLKSVIYHSCSQVVDDRFQMRDRSVQRVQLMIRLLKANSLFCRILIKHISQLQTSREELLQTEQRSRTWLFNNVSKITSVIKYGTLKNSCINYMETRLTPLFAGLISLMDTNRNLDLLSANGWTPKFWLFIFDDENLLKFSYKSNYLVGDNVEKGQFTCAHIADDKIELKLPFSWIIKQHLDELMGEFNRLDGENVQLFNQIKNAYEQSEIKLKLDDFLNTIDSAERRRVLNDIYDSYLYDYILMSSEECFANVRHVNLVHKRILNYLTLTLEIKKDLVSIAYAYGLLRKEIHLFQKFVRLNDRTVDILTNSDNQRQNLCFLAARILVNDFKNVSSAMKTDEWKKWFETVRSASQLMETLNSVFSPDEIAANDSDVESFRSLWQRVALTGFFIENICRTNPQLYERCIALWNYFNDDPKVDMKDPQSFDRMLRIVTGISKSVMNALKKDAVCCLGCNSCDFERMYTVDECRACQLCEECVKESTITKRCAKCSKELRTLTFTESQTPNLSNQKIKNFKSNLNSFLMDVVTNLCFDKMYQSLPDSKVIDKIIVLLLPKNRDVKDANQAIDFNVSPSIKSTLFQFLLNYSADRVEMHLNDIFNKSSAYLRSKYQSDDLTNLMLMYVNCLEDNFHSKSEQVYGVANLNEFVEETRRIMTNEWPNENHLHNMNLIARIRFCLVSFSNMILSLDDANHTQNELVLKIRHFVENTCPSEHFKFFLIKNIIRRYGQSEFNNLLKFQNFKWMLPAHMSHSNEDVLIDSYLVLDESYKQTRESVRDCLLTGDTRTLKSCIQSIKDKTSLYFKLSVYKELYLKSNLSSEQLVNFKESTENIVYSHDDAKTIFQLLNDARRLNALVKNDKNQHILMLFMHLFALYNVQELRSIYLLDVFREIYRQPANFVASFLPSMPHDQDFELLQVFKNLTARNGENLGYKTCKNGHIYTIGECQQPVVSSICPTCKEPIGAIQDHRLHPDNANFANLEAKEESGYLTDDMDNYYKAKFLNIRNMGVVNTFLIRIILDSTLYLASMTNGDQVMQLIKGGQKPSRENLGEYFYQNFTTNLTALSNYLQNSPDEVLLLVHFILDKLYVRPSNTVHRLDSKETRNLYEMDLVQSIGQINQHENVENLIGKLTAIVSDDARKSTSSNTLYRISYDLIEPSGCSNSTDSLFRKEFWMYRKQLTLKIFTNAFRIFYESRTNEQKVHFALMNKFLADLNQLKAIKYLPSVVQMIHVLYSALNRQIDKRTAAKLTLDDLIHANQTLGNSRALIEKGVENFLKMWSQLSEHIQSNSRMIIKRLKTNRLEERPTNLPVSYLLPSTNGDGIYIYALLVYVISLQDEFLKFYYSQRAPDVKAQTSVDLVNLTQNDCINISIKQKLQKIIYSHSNYTLEHVKEVNFNFDFEEIQKSVEMEFFFDKPIINFSNIPVIQFSDDFNDLSRFSLLRKRIKQIELSFALKEKISVSYQTPNELNDMIRKLHIVIDFVISSGFAKDFKIMDYASNVLQMTNLDDCDSNKLINELEIRYLESLWNLLNLRRAILLTEHRQDPFDLLDEKYRVEFGPCSHEEADNQMVNKIKNGRKYLNSNNLYNILDYIHKLLVYKLITVTPNNNENEFNPKMDIDCVLSEDFSEQLGTTRLEFKLDELDLSDVKLENVHSLWTALVHIYLEEKN